MTRRTLIVVALAGLLAALPASPALAQKPTLDSRLEVRFEATPAADVFRNIISGLGLELQLDPKVEGPVTIWVKDVSARTALNVVCESLGCQWRVTGNRLVVSQTPGASGRLLAIQGSGSVSVKLAPDKRKELATDTLSRFKKPLPVDMQFRDVPVSTILRAMSEASGLEITADEPLASQHVTLTGTEKTVQDALNAIVKHAGGKIAMLTVVDRDRPGSPTIRIWVKAGPAAEKK